MPIPLDNPYLPAIEAVGSFANPATPLDAATLALVTQVLHVGAEVRSVDWGIDYARPPREISFPHINPSHALSRQVLAEADRLIGSHPRAAALLVLDLLAFGRHVGRGCPTVRSAGTLIELRSSAWLGRHLPRFGPATADALRERFARLPSRGSWRDSLQKDRAKIEAVIHQLGLLVWRQAGTDPAPASDSLRMTGLLLDSGNVSLGVETPGARFRLELRETLHGITFVAVDLERQQALLSEQGRLVRLHLETRSFTDMDGGGVRAALATLVPDHPLRRYCEIVAASASSGLPDSLREWRGALAELAAAQEAMLALVEASSGSPPAFPVARPPGAKAGLFLDARADAQTIASFITADRIRDAQLAAALAAAVAGRPPSDAIDPSADQPFRIIPTPGGYILESATADHHGNPRRFVVGEAPPENAAK